VAPVSAVVFLDRCFELSIAFVSARVPSLRAYRHQPQLDTCEQRSDKKGSGIARSVSQRRCGWNAILYAVSRARVR
jgi:hypothetical protein